MTCSHSPRWLLANGVRDLNGFNPAIFTDRSSTMTVVIHVKREGILKDGTILEAVVVIRCC